jgi:galactokinase
VDDLKLVIEQAFADAYEGPPDLVVRAPGRVNLIGEHTDYSLLPVLPIAIERSVLVAARASNRPEFRARSLRFPEAMTLFRSDLRIHSGWGRYLAAALREMDDIQPGRGADLLVGGDLPATGGLSSSSALTMGIMAALNAAWGGGLSMESLVERAIRAERHVGVESGGMDQTVIAFATPGTALRIDFQPPGRRTVPIPEGLAFVVASSGLDAPKGDAAQGAYNERVIGARLAAAMLTDHVGLDIGHPPYLADVASIDVIDILVDDLPERITAREVAHGADADIAMLIRLTADTWDPRAKVPVKRVARHILSEAERVDTAEAALAAGELAAFGELLNESHNSLREDLRCSTPALDRVCAAMRKAGAYGARLTGAGFGGFALAAVAPERLAAVMEAARAATNGEPVFEVHASGGLELL